MRSEWLQTTVGEFLKINGGELKTGPFGTKLKASEYSSEGVPVISVGEIQLGRIVLHKRTPNVSPETTSKMPEYILQKGDIVFGRKGSVERSARVKDEQNGWFLGSDGIRLRLPNCCDTRFIAYQFLTEAHKKWMIQHAAGTTMASLNEKIINRIPLVVPPINTQKSIAHILGTLDNKIELNRQTNQTLEQMAQTLFKSWFVDFDPVIDNALAAGNPIPDELQERAEHRQQQLAKPDHKPLPDDILQLFPSEFELTEELVWVPKGWEETSLGERFQLLSGHPFKSSSYLDDGDYGVVTIRNVQDGSFVEECANRTTDIPEKMKEHCKLDQGDILLSLTGNVGRVCIVSSGKYLLNQRVAKIQGNGAIPRSMAYFFFRQKRLYEMMITIAKGTAQQNLSPIETISLKCVMPSNNIITKLAAPYEALFSKMVRNTVQSQALTKLRDTLLPKLISGELRLPSEALADLEQQPANAIA